MKKMVFLSLLVALPSGAVDLSEIKDRNLFRPLIAPAPKPLKIRVPLPVAPPPPPKIPLSQRVSNLKLVGIMDTDPRQAIIEDQRSQKTLYISAGQPINDVQVEKITNDAVVLTSDGEHFNLSL